MERSGAANNAERWRERLLHNFFREEQVTHLFDSVEKTSLAAKCESKPQKSFDPGIAKIQPHDWGGGLVNSLHHRLLLSG